MFSIKEFLGLAYYTSPLDKFLKEYDKTHPEHSASKQQEMQKYTKIYALRDNANAKPVKPAFWDKF